MRYCPDQAKKKKKDISSKQTTGLMDPMRASTN